MRGPLSLASTAHIRSLMTIAIHPQSKHPITGHLDVALIPTRIDMGLRNDVLDSSIFLVAGNSILVRVGSASDS